MDYMLTNVEHWGRMFNRNLNKETDMTYACFLQGPWAVGTNDAPRYPGVYIVYAKVWLGEPQVLYIGESDNIASRMAGHDRREDWEREARGQPLFFVAVPIASAYERERVERKMISRCRPPCNREVEPLLVSWNEMLPMIGPHANTESRQRSWNEIMSECGSLFDKRTRHAPNRDEDPLNAAVDAYISRNHVAR